MTLRNNWLVLTTFANAHNEYTFLSPLKDISTGPKEVDSVGRENLQVLLSKLRMTIVPLLNC